jgi:alpha-tubulin suppressor-like RCC1 family protein
VHRVATGRFAAFAIGEDGELFSWGSGEDGRLGHGNARNQRSPKRVEVLRGVRVSSVSVRYHHALALAEDGLVYAWGENSGREVLGNPDVESELLPTPVEALRNVCVGSIAATNFHSYAVAYNGDLWAWGGATRHGALGQSEQPSCSLPSPVESLQGIKVDAVTGSTLHTMALADDGSVHAWGAEDAAHAGALGLGPSVSDAGLTVPTPQRIPALRVACGL